MSGEPIMIRRVVEHFRTKYRMGWLWLWVAIVMLMGGVFATALGLLFHPARWVVFVACGGFGLLMPTPRWVRKQPPPKAEHPSWLRRRSNRYDAAVLGRLMLGDYYTYDIWRHIGGSSGAIMLALARLERAGMVCSDWAEQPEGPERRRYELTELGRILGRVDPQPRGPR